MIKIQNLVKRRGSQTILNGINLEIPKSEVCVLIGPSGGGKSTLLRCINGLESFEDGEIEVGNIQLNPTLSTTNRDANLLELRKQIGMVFQSFNLFANLNVLQNVMAGPSWVLKQPKEQAEVTAKTLLKRVGLEGKELSRPHELSGGQQQRVAIARALAVNPIAILFDEPTSALDPELAREVTSVIAELAKEGRTMLVVTHDMDFARQVATRVILMVQGQIAKSGSPQEMLKH
jgi:polar amino acid transport system ATP-binding protein